jgi:hypothetical protein
MKKILVLSLIAISFGTVAESKVLECLSSTEGEIARLSDDLADIEKDSPRYERGIRRAKEVRERCKDKEYGSSYIITFDTDGLKSTDVASVEVDEVISCGLSQGKYKGTMIASPTSIQFSNGRTNRFFNVSRKTLKGGYEKDTNYICNLKDIDTSDNLI